MQIAAFVALAPKVATVTRHNARRPEIKRTHRLFTPIVRRWTITQKWRPATGVVSICQVYTGWIWVKHLLDPSRIARTVCYGK